ncbi:MAG: acylphosphatase [Burkholderiaceae bacterium]|nr:MAG: acylphosphatase [Burkholderiaceae bacterium]
MTKHLKITGLVQGVGYRFSFQREALSLHLSGWVRNCRDGSVEALVIGEAQALERIIAWARRGPPGAAVREVFVSEADDGAVQLQGFEILPTQ